MIARYKGKKKKTYRCRSQDQEEALSDVTFVVLREKHGSVGTGEVGEDERILVAGLGQLESHAHVVDERR